MIQDITPILAVDEIEPSLPFWTARLGFEVTASVPEAGPDAGGPLGFVMLTRDGRNVMLQTRRSIRDDVPAALGDDGNGAQILFVVVDDLDGVIERLEGAEVIVPERTTFYGMREIGVREPGGHTVIIAQPIEGN